MVERNNKYFFLNPQYKNEKCKLNPTTVAVDGGGCFE